jgi:hypothetical protein
MFYIKSKQQSGKTVKTEITDENVFTRCPECGRELPVDLAEVFADGEGDLFSTSIVCSACVKKRKKTLSTDMDVTLDGLILLVSVMNKAGYGEQICNLYTLFEVDDPTELTPSQYKPFADALCDLATGDLAYEQ